MSKKILTSVLIILLLSLGVVVVYNISFNQNQFEKQPLSQEVPDGSTVSISIGGVMEESPIEISENETVLSSLKRLSAENDFEVETKEYSGLGTLVERIGKYTNGEDNKYWQYTVNDVMPQVGADALVLAPGDRIVWDFKKSEF